MDEQAKLIFNLLIKSREGVLFDGKVKSVTSYNEKGIFDILSEHANFISLIEKKLTVVDLEDRKKEIDFDKALVRVRDNNVEVYLGVESILHN